MCFKTLFYCSTQMPSSTLEANGNLFSKPIEPLFLNYLYFPCFLRLFMLLWICMCFYHSEEYRDFISLQIGHFRIFYDQMPSERPQHIRLSHRYVGFSKLIWRTQIFRALQSATKNVVIMMYEEKEIEGLPLACKCCPSGLA